MFTFTYEDTRTLSDLVEGHYVITKNSNQYDWFNPPATTGTDSYDAAQSSIDLHTVIMEDLTYYAFGVGDAAGDYWCYTASWGDAPLSWTLFPNLPSTTVGVKSMAYDPNNDIRLFAEGGSGTVHMYNAGVWSTHDYYPAEFYSIHYNNGMFMSVSSDGARTSIDGINWTKKTSTQSLQLVYSVGSRWVAVGVDTSQDLYYSDDDGDTWTLCNMIGSGFSAGTIDTSSYHRMHFRNIRGTYYICSTLLYFTSTDGINWTYGTAGINAYADVGWDGTAVKFVPTFQSIDGA